MRGTLDIYFHRALSYRFIPAHAGNSGHTAAQRPLASVHPRACGELKDSQFGRYVSSGSSPRMRGTRCIPIRGRLHIRFIPAHAGNSSTVRMARRTNSVHPRACGELGFPAVVRAVNNGSSPRMRGTHKSSATLKASGSFIPAHAGNSLFGLHSADVLSVHPRACGELLRRRGRGKGSPGSSPRMRGTRSDRSRWTGA